MNTKLTLKLKKRSIDRAKRYAKKNKRSLSSLVENYFDIISEKENASEFEISPNVLELAGIISLPENYNIKDDYRKHISEKLSK